MYTAADTATRIQDLCAEHCISIEQLADRSEVPVSEIRDIVTGADQDPGIVTIKRICEGLGIELAEFFKDS